MTTMLTKDEQVVLTPAAQVHSEHLDSVTAAFHRQKKGH